MTPHCPACAASIPEGAERCPGCGTAAPPPAGDGAAGPPPDLPPRYRVERFLGRGAMGRVFLCRDVALDVEVAVKVLPSDLASDPEAVEQVRGEARIAARLRDGPGILPLHGFESHGGTWFLVEEYAPGGTLQDLLKTRGPLPEAEVRRIGAEVAEALAFAHAARVLHRDVKPSNVLLDARGRARLADFGLAKAIAEASSRRSGSSVAGTPTYMAPETMWDGKADERSDLYGLGCLLFECATGGRPFEGVYHEIARAKTAAAEVPDPRVRSPALSAGFADLVRRLLASDPAARPASAADAAAALREGAAPPAPPAPPRAPGAGPPPGARQSPGGPLVIAGSSRLSQRIRPLRRPALGVGLVLLAGGAAAVLVPLPRENPPSRPDAPPAGEEHGEEQAFLDLPDLPADAEVFADGRRVGRGPGTFAVPPGSPSITLLREGYEPVELPSRRLAAGAVGRVDAPPWHRAPALGPSTTPPPAAPGRPERLPDGVREEAGRLFSPKDGAEMAFVPEGEFLMGQDGGHPANAPAHRVRLSAVFVDRHEVTNAQFARFVRETGHRTDAERIGTAPVLLGAEWRDVLGASWRHPEGPESSIEGRDRHPVVQVSWNDARAYARWAGKRLPTEAEFERWLRRGLEGARFPWGDAEDPPPGTGNLADRAFRAVPGQEDRPVAAPGYEDPFPGPAPVGSFPPDPFGLFDVCGNVWEWCEDRLDETFYARSPERDPCNLGPGGFRIYRGGSCMDDGLQNMECTYRNRGRASGANASVGFRCVLDAQAR